MTTYVGSGPYCYSNSLVMMLGAEAPPVGVIETLTGSPFGAHVEEGTMPFFDPAGWHPEIGVDAALSLLGWSCLRTAGGPPEEALGRLRAAAAHGPVMVGPLEMGLLLYQPNSGIAIGADHYVVVLAVDGDTVLIHDPQGYPCATLPTGAFLESWRGETVTYNDTPFVMRSAFTKQHTTTPVLALESALPQAIQWLDGAPDTTEEIAELADRGLHPDTRGLLRDFCIRVGARRLQDAASSLMLLNRRAAADIAVEQSRIVGGLQYPAVTGDDRALAAGLRELAPGYERLRKALL